MRRWAPLSTVPATCSAAFSKNLADKNAELRRITLGGVLAALQPACTSPEATLSAGGAPAHGRASPDETPPAASAPPMAALVTLLAGVAEPLLAMLKPALKKAPVGPSRVDAIAALCCLREGAALSPAVEKACVADKLWTSVLKAKDSFLWQAEPLAAASEKELKLLCRLLGGILRTPAQVRQ